MVRSRGRAVAAVTLLSAVAGFVSVPAASADDVGDRKQSLDRRLDDLRDDLEGTSQDLVDAAVDLRRAQSELTDTRAALASARSRLDAAQARDAAIADELEVARAAVAKATRELTTRQEGERATRARLGSIARETYVSAGLAGLSIALDAESPQQFADRVSAAGTAMRTQNGAIDRLRVMQAETRARTSKLNAAEDRVEALKKESETLVAARRSATAEAAAAEARISRLTASRAGAVRVISARKASEKNRLDSLEREQDRLADLLRRREGGSGGGGSDGGSTLSYPVSAPVTSGFGWRYHPILHYSRLHAGTDFGAPCGTPVRAAAGGSVVRAGWSGGFGNQVVVEHGRMRGVGLASSYNHLSRIIVRSGRVSRGQVIAYSGTTGLSTGCHLHFEVYVDGEHVNPMGWL